MPNIAETVKKQTDRILRQRQLNGSEGVVVSGVSSGTGAPAPTVNSPAADLTAHKASADHDGRYYTEDEVDGLLNFVGLSDTPAAYTGAGSKVVAVKADVSGLEFVAAPAAANGIPTGGTAGQVLEKIDGTDYNTQWVDVNAVKIKSKPVNILDFTGKDGYILAYDETADEFYLKADDGGGGGESTFTFFARSDKSFFAWDDFEFTTISEPV